MSSRQLIRVTSSNILRRYLRGLSSNPPEIKSRDEIEAMIKKSKVVLFMKGTPQDPLCGFSRLVAQILRMHDIKYDSYNVLDDQSIREGVKKFSEWPTIPQLYVDGKFVGGADITLQMHQNGDLIDLLQQAGIKSALLEKNSNQEKDK